MNAKIKYMLALCVLMCMFTSCGKDDPEIPEDATNGVIDITDIADTVMSVIPYLQAPAPTAMTVMWVTFEECRGSVEYHADSSVVASGKGTKAYGYDDGIPVAKTRIHKVLIKNLQAGKKYYYRVNSEKVLKYESYNKVFDEAYYSDIFSFTTFNDQNTDFTVLVFNDLQRSLGESQLSKFAPVIADLKYNLVVFNGNCLNDLNKEDDLTTWLNKYAKFAKGSQVPVIYLRGNRETRGAMAHLLKNYVDYVKDGKSYGAMNLGDTRLLFLDTGENKSDNDPGLNDMADYEAYRQEQTNYLDIELNNPKYTNAAKRVLIHHIPLFSSVMYGRNEYNPGLELWGERLNAANINIALTGYVQEFEYIAKEAYDREMKNNYPVYIGGGLEPNRMTMAVLSKSGSVLSLKVYDSNGAVKVDETY